LEATGAERERALDVGAHEVGAEDVRRVRGDLREHGVELLEGRDPHPTTRAEPAARHKPFCAQRPGVSISPGAVRSPGSRPARAPVTDRPEDDMFTASQARTSGYADVNGVHMYYELHGDGSPLVLLHGGMMTIELNFATLLPTLAASHTVIGVELQGHGRTADVDRRITPAALAADVVGLLDHLGVERAHVLGHSMGGAVALELAVNHPHRVRSVVPISASVRPDGIHADIADPARHATSTRMPTQQDFADMQEDYQRLSPHPEHFSEFLAELSSSNADLQGWSDEQLAGITAPTLLVLGDHDFTTVEHGSLMHQLVPRSQLAVLPDTTHMQITRRAELLLPILARFLD
jgi:pimeloyl-ACP methyl ester carboxylesterase